jgi:D-3-phosphoglycerate dehydrogenase / 2-oxoglutarate reductase
MGAMTKILITDGLDKIGLELLAAQAQVADRNGISAEDLLKEIGEYDALIVRGRTKVTASVLEAATRLKVVGRAGVGVDNIDLTAAKGRGVMVVNSPTATTVAVAELAFSLLLAVSRDIARADASMKAGKWLKKELEGVELYGKTLGVIGFGRIGAETGKRAAAFGMQVLGYDPLIPAAEITARGGEPVSLDDLYARSDFITLHIPLTPETKNMINTDALAKMKDGVRIVCDARGGVIDESALLAALNSEKVAAAGLDVFMVEPPGLTDLVAHPRVVCTPHIGAQTAESQSRAAEHIAEEILTALSGEAPRWRVA